MLRLYAAGSNARGQLASGNSDDQHCFQPAHFALSTVSSTLPRGASRILNIACGSNHTLVLLDTHELYACGDSTRGQLSSLSSASILSKLSLDLARWDLDDSYKITGVAASWETSFLIYAPADPALSDVVLSFGADDFGDRGAGSQPTVDPSVVDFRQSLSGQPWLIKVRELVAGPHHVVARLEVWAEKDARPVGVVVGWGASRHGQLGSLPPASKPKSRDGPQTNKLDRPTVIATYTDNEQPIQLAVGSQHSLILHNSHRVLALGSSRRGQLDIPKSLLDGETSQHPTQQIGCTWSSSFLVTNNPWPSTPSWRIASCGSSNHGQLGRTPSPDLPFGPVVNLPYSTHKLRQIACGSEHVLVLAGNEVWGWGWNEHGNLGVGHTEDVLEPVRIWDNKVGRTVLGVWAGCGTSWVLVEEDEKSSDEAS